MRMIATLFLVAAGLYVLLGAFLYLMQERLVFLPGIPGRALETTPARIGLDYDDVELRTPDGVILHGWYVHAEEPRGVVLFLHGNAGNISHRLDSIAIFSEISLDVFIFDYRGYGRSGGRPSERGTYLDAETAWQYLLAERGLEPGRIVVFGRSLGGAVAAWLAAGRQPAAVIVESTFTSAADMAKHLYPFMPVRLLLTLDYDTAGCLARATSPVLVVHSRGDEIIPFAMGKALYGAAPQPKAFLELSGDHNTGFLMQRERYRDGLTTFVSAHLRDSKQPAD